MSLDFYLEQEVTEIRDVFSGNITHNLGKMAAQSGLYYPLWRATEHGLTEAHQLIPLLEFGLSVLKSNPDEFVKYNPEGWGDYGDLVRFTQDALNACRSHPNAKVRISR